MSGYPPEGIVLRFGRSLFVLSVAYHYVCASFTETLFYLFEACFFSCGEIYIDIYYNGFPRFGRVRWIKVAYELLNLLMFHPHSSSQHMLHKPTILSLCVLSVCNTLSQCVYTHIIHRGIQNYVRFYKYKQLYVYRY